MPLTVLSIAYPFAPVDADPAGGAEQVLAQIDRALVKAGHRSIVIAAEGSEVAGELVPVGAVNGEIDDRVRAERHQEVRAATAALLDRERIDLIHLHGIDFHAYPPPPGPPALVTLHLPLAWYPADALAPSRPRTFLQPVSADQARRGDPGLNLLPPIPNGVDTARLHPSEGEGDYVAFLGRVAPEKGLHDALAAARAAAVPLRAAGRLFPYPAHQAYFAEQVEPLLERERRWLGPVAGEAKRKLLAEARALLIPSTAPETSSLVAMEAFACGTPVIAYRSGALPDIVEEGVTGLLVDDAEEMAAAIGRLDEIDRAACRAAACERFPLERATAAYLALYQRLAA